MDRGTSPGTVKVTLQWYHGGEPAQGSQGGGGASVLLANRDATGQTVADAMTAIQASTDRQFNFGVSQVILLSEDLAREGSAQYLDYLWRKTESPQLAQVIVVHGGAGDILRSGGPSGTAFRLYDYMQTARAVSAGSIPVPFWRFLSLCHTTTQAAWAPVIGFVEGHFAGTGTAVFLGDRMTGTLNPVQTSALTWILRQGGLADLNLPKDGGSPSISLHLRSVRASKSIDSHGLMHLRVDMAAQVQEGVGVNLSRVNLRALETTAANVAVHDITTAMAKLQSLSSDVIGFGELLREHSPQQTTDWPVTFRRLPVMVHVSVRIESGGRAA